MFWLFVRFPSVRYRNPHKYSKHIFLKVQFLINCHLLSEGFHVCQIIILTYFVVVVSVGKEDWLYLVTVCMFMLALHPAKRVLKQNEYISKGNYFEFDMEVFTSLLRGGRAGGGEYSLKEKICFPWGFLSKNLNVHLIEN